MKTYQLVLTGAILAFSMRLAYAANVNGLTTFSSGTPAVAAEVNGNFAAVKSAVDNNNTRVTTLEANPSITGNLTLVPSTATLGTPTAGNIMKGTAPFLHNYGASNTFLGVNAGNFTMTGAGNTASGSQALQSNTTGLANIASGYRALFSNTIGNYNTASGFQALFSNIEGYHNTATGYQALNHATPGLFLTNGNYNTATGSLALFSNSTGPSNTADGYQALYSNTIGSGNVASGNLALYSNTTGSGNVAIGYGALQNTTGVNGSYNIGIGMEAGIDATTGNYNIYIGNRGVAAEFQTIRIGSTLQSKTFIAGIFGRTTSVAGAAVYIDTYGQLGTISSSRRFKDHIDDMGKTSDVLMKLRPVTFYYKTDQNPNGRTLQYGLIAEEVDEVAPNLVVHSADGKIETVLYQHIAPMLLNEYQKQQHTIAAQQVLLEKQNAHIAAIEKQVMEVAELKQQLNRMTAMLNRMQQSERLAAAR